jgi:glycosyltransferase involved in cell wall biosynthesis
MANKILEAMMCGLPVITNIAQEFIHNTSCGIVVEYGNVNQIKQAIVSLKENPQLRKSLGEMVVKHFYKNIIGQIWKKNYIQSMKTC